MQLEQKMAKYIKKTEWMNGCHAHAPQLLKAIIVFQLCIKELMTEA